MKPEGSLPSSQDPAHHWFYHEPDESRSLLHILFFRFILILYPHTGPPKGLALFGFMAEILHAFLSLPPVLHASPTSSPSI
jgi:hypothetical protein